MKPKILKTMLFTLTLAFILTACNIPLFVSPPDVQTNAEQTAVAETIAARLTQVAQNWTETVQPTETQLPPTATNTPEPTNTPIPTNTPVPTFTPTATSVPVPCNAAYFIKDMTVSDGAQMLPDTSFVKIWRLQNVGSCTWTKDYEITFDGGDKMGGSTTSMPEKVYPGEVVDVKIQMKAPDSKGNYKGYWILRDEDGDKFGLGSAANLPMWVQIKVVEALSSMPFDFAEEFCNATWKSDNATLYCYGTSQGYSNYVYLTTSFQMESGKIEDEPALIINVENENRVRGTFPAYTVQAGDRFVSRIGCLQASEDCKVEVLLRYKIKDTDTTGILGEWTEKNDGSTTLIDIDLSSLVDKKVIFILDVSAKGSAHDNEMFWFVPGIRNP